MAEEVKKKSVKEAVAKAAAPKKVAADKPAKAATSNKSAVDKPAKAAAPKKAVVDKPAKAAAPKKSAADKPAKKAATKKSVKTLKKVLFVTAESGPFVRTGGLGDVAASLPQALCDIGTDTRVILPLYHDIPSEMRSTMKFVGSMYVTLAWRYQYCGIFSCSYKGVAYYFIDNEYYFKRWGLYGHYDDAERFAFFSKAVLESIKTIDFVPDIIHCNDWHTALVPVFLDTFYRGYDEYKAIKTVFTIHNIEFQGKYSKNVTRDILGLPEGTETLVEYNDCVNFMKGGIESANVVTTVSPSYANEILDRYYAWGLEMILKERSFKLSGIVNGIDTELYNPLNDTALFAKYGYDTIEVKKINKKGLCDMLQLDYDDHRPLIGMVTRLTEQKGLDLLMTVIDELLTADVQLVILGKGDWRYENTLSDAMKRYPNKLKVIINFSTDVANKIYGGSDMFLMPSKFEPCGLSQMISMGYGTIPIVRATGGLRDTVQDFNSAELSGNGFNFQAYNAYDMLDAIHRAISTYQNKREWNAIIANAMNTDFSWKQSATKYLELYNKI